MKTGNRVLIVDDHPLFREGLRHALANDGEFDLVGEANDGVEALRSIEALQPDVAIIDIELPKLDGLSVAQTIQQSRMITKVIFLTMHKKECLFNAAIERGAKGFVLKENAVNEILDSLKAVMQGDCYFSPSVSNFLLRRSERFKNLRDENPELASLTSMERRILKSISENKTTREIAAEFFISPFTVETHRRNICEKLALKGSQPLLRFALLHKAEL